MKELRDYVDGYDYKQQCNNAAQARHCAGLSEIVGFLNDFVDLYDWLQWYKDDAAASCARYSFMEQETREDLARDLIHRANAGLRAIYAATSAIVDVAILHAELCLSAHTAAPLPDGAADDLAEIRDRGAENFTQDEIDKLYDKYPGSYKMAAALLDAFKVGPAGMIPGEDFNFVNAKQLRAKLDDLRVDVARFVDTYGGTLTPEWRDLLDGAEIYALARQLEAFAMKNNPESRPVKI